ncbi:MAG TPA: cation diffusion facilitator family transporter [Leptospiraceae bacterium]|nr:cation diffusion facilitator family transporter [Leptospiraceae bacterium]HRG74479.1 cation diffusion facilitator family transporter [Leptospiraceae bacterium]
MHDHHQHHHHSHEISDLNKRFILGIILNSLFVLVEAGSGFYYNSLALLSDAGHNLSDVASLLLALLAFRLAKIQPDTKYTYGYRKTTILVSLLNAIVLLLAMGGIIWESVQRFQTQAPTNGNPIAFVAAVGILINALTAWLFLKDKERDLNVKGAYLHMLSDALVSLGVLIAGVIIAFTNWYWVDGVISIIIAIVVLFSTLDLLKKSFHLSIDAVPEGIHIVDIKKEMEMVQGVLEVHHIHVWAISTTLNALTAHVKIRSDIQWKDVMRIKKNIRHSLLHQNILHSTIEFETEEEICEEMESEI